MRSVPILLFLTLALALLPVREATACSCAPPNVLLEADRAVGVVVVRGPRPRGNVVSTAPVLARVVATLKGPARRRVTVEPFQICGMSPLQGGPVVVFVDAEGRQAGNGCEVTPLVGEWARSQRLAFGPVTRALRRWVAATDDQDRRRSLLEQLAAGAGLLADNARFLLRPQP